MGLLSKKNTDSGVATSTLELTIQNRNGLHARPAAMFVKTSSRYQAEIWVVKDGEKVNGKSIMGLMMLAAGKGSIIEVTAEGADGEEALEALSKLVDSSFGEE